MSAICMPDKIKNNDLGLYKFGFILNSVMFLGV